MTADRFPRLPASWISTLVAVLAAATVEVVFDTLWAIVRHPPAASYLALCAALTFAAALAAVAPVALARTEFAVGLGLWAGIHGFLGYEAWPQGLAMGAAMAVLSWALLRGGGPVSAGVGLATALVLTLIFWPRVVGRFGLPRAESPAGGLLEILLFGALLTLYSTYARRRRARGSRVPARALGLGALVLVMVSSGLWQRRSAAPEPAAVEPHSARAGSPSIVLLVLDTVRADRLSVYGYERDTTPFLETLVGSRPRAVLFPMAFAPSNWTLPSHVSLLTGEIPSVHGVHTRRLEPGTPAARHRIIRAERTLPELMQARGYRTGAVIANVLLTEVRGIRRGFDSFLLPSTPRPMVLVGEQLRARFLPRVAARAVLPYPPAAEITDRVLEFVDRSGGRPFFLLANYMDAHSPYLPPKPYAGRYTAGFGGRPPIEPHAQDSPRTLAYAGGRYDEEIRALDADIGRLFEELDRRGVLDASWVVITSDHGESFGEHGEVFHATSVYNEQVRVPLIIQPPIGEAVTAVDQAVDLLDVTATLAAAVGGEPLGHGRDLRAGEVLRPVQIEFFGNWRRPGEDKFGPLTYVPARAVVARTTKLIEYPDRRQLFELAVDPAEATDLAGREIGRADALVPLLPPLERAAATEDGEALPEPSEEDLQKLRALGYVD